MLRCIFLVYFSLFTSSHSESLFINVEAEGFSSALPITVNEHVVASPVLAHVPTATIYPLPLEAPSPMSLDEYNLKEQAKEQTRQEAFAVHVQQVPIFLLLQ